MGISGIFLVATAMLLLPVQSAARMLHSTEQHVLSKQPQQQQAPGTNADSLVTTPIRQRRSLLNSKQELTELALISLAVDLDPSPAITLQKGEAVTISGTVSGRFYNKIRVMVEDYPITLVVSNPGVLSCTGMEGAHVHLGRNAADKMLRKGSFKFDCVANAEGTATATVTVDSPNNDVTGEATIAPITVHA